MQRTLIDNRYELGEPLGGGGMANVYLAHDRLLGRDVAVKILRGQYAEDREFVERFRREAQNAAGLSHPNIVQTYDRGETGDGSYYIAMEHVPGGTLSERIERDGALAASTVAEVAFQVADALGAAHEAGLIHRDIKPHNVLVTDRGDVKVADFGIARAVEETSVSRTSAVIGTAAYMSPEQALGRELGPQSDLYSLGVVLYEMLTGELPFTGASPTAVSLMHVNEEPRPPAEIQPGIPPGTNALVMKLLVKDPAERYGSATELMGDLDRVSEGLNPLNAGVAGGAAIGAGGAGLYAEATTLDANGVDEATPGPASPTRATGSAPAELGGFRVQRGSSRRAPFKRLLGAAVLVLALIGAIGWFVGSGDGPGVAGSLDGVPELPGKIGEAIGGGSEALADTITGPEQLEVPPVEGLAKAAATERLKEAGFDSQTRPRRSTVGDAGVVLEQSVAGGEKAEEGSTILLAVGSGPSNSVGTSAQDKSTGPAQGGSGGSSSGDASSGGASGGNSSSSSNGGYGGDGSQGGAVNGGNGGYGGSGSDGSGIAGTGVASGAGVPGSYAAPGDNRDDELEKEEPEGEDPGYAQYESAE